MAILSFADKDAQNFFETGKSRRGVKWSRLRGIVSRKLDMVHYAVLLSDLRSPPGNHLEALRGNLSGCYSIRINDQWRIVFRWGTSGPFEVRVIDYH